MFSLNTPTLVSYQRFCL